MKKAIAVLLLLTLSSFTAESDVYICGPHGAKKYHYAEDCRGLNAWKHKIIRVPLSQARGYGLDLCGWED